MVIPPVPYTADFNITPITLLLNDHSNWQRQSRLIEVFSGRLGYEHWDLERVTLLGGVGGEVGIVDLLAEGTCISDSFRRN